MPFDLKQKGASFGARVAANGQLAGEKIEISCQHRRNDRFHKQPDNARRRAGRVNLLDPISMQCVRVQHTKNLHSFDDQIKVCPKMASLFSSLSLSLCGVFAFSKCERCRSACARDKQQAMRAETTKVKKKRTAWLTP